MEISGGPKALPSERAGSFVRCGGGQPATRRLARCLVRRVTSIPSVVSRWPPCHSPSRGVSRRCEMICAVSGALSRRKRPPSCPSPAEGFLLRNMGTHEGVGGPVKKGSADWRASIKLEEGTAAGLVERSLVIHRREKPASLSSVAGCLWASVVVAGRRSPVLSKTIPRMNRPSQPTSCCWS